MRDLGDRSWERIPVFEKEIEQYEDLMFGLMLYQETSPKWVKRQQQTSYENMKRRGEKALKNAKKILMRARQGKSVRDMLRQFEWPIILQDMRFRIDIMLECYAELFPGRPRETILSDEEATALRNAAIARI